MSKDDCFEVDRHNTIIISESSVVNSNLNPGVMKAVYIEALMHLPGFEEISGYLLPKENISRKHTGSTTRIATTAR